MRIRYMAALLSVLLVTGVVLAAAPRNGTGTTEIASGIAQSLCDFQHLVKGVLPTLALIMFLFAGLAYAAGQAFGAETKAKAQGWAMSLLVGGIIGIILAVLAPIFVSIFINMTTGMDAPDC